MEVWPESLGALLEYWYIERGLLFSYQVKLKADKNIKTGSSNMHSLIYMTCPVVSHSFLMELTTILETKMKYWQAEDNIFFRNQPQT